MVWCITGQIRIVCKMRTDSLWNSDHNSVKTDLDNLWVLVNGIGDTRAAMKKSKQITGGYRKRWIVTSNGSHGRWSVREYGQYRRLLSKYDDKRGVAVINADNWRVLPSFWAATYRVELKLSSVSANRWVECGCRRGGRSEMELSNHRCGRGALKRASHNKAQYGRRRSLGATCYWWLKVQLLNRWADVDCVGKKELEMSSQRRSLKETGWANAVFWKHCDE